MTCDGLAQDVRHEHQINLFPVPTVLHFGHKPSESHTMLKAPLLVR